MSWIGELRKYHHLIFQVQCYVSQLQRVKISLYVTLHDVEFKNPSYNVIQDHEQKINHRLRCTKYSDRCTRFEIVEPNPRAHSLLQLTRTLLQIHRKKINTELKT